MTDNSNDARMQTLEVETGQNERQRAAVPHTTASVLRTIIVYKCEHDGLSPTIREIMEATGISSTSVVAYHLKRLEVQGHIRRGYGCTGIEVVGGRWLAPEGVYA